MHFPANSRRQPEPQNILIHFGIYSSIGIVAMQCTIVLQCKAAIAPTMGVKYGKLKASDILEYTLQILSILIVTVLNFPKDYYHTRLPASDSLERIIILPKSQTR